MDRRVRAILTMAFVLRASIGLMRLGEPLGANGYGFYLSMARSLLRGDGVCLEPGVGCALRVPVYPSFLASALMTPWPHAVIIVAQAAAGTALVWVIWKTAGDLVGSGAAMLTASLAAVHPYFVIHDTALQETVIVNALLAAAVWTLVRARRSGAPADGLAAGAALGLAVLTTARVSLVVAFALAWMLAGWPSWRAGLRQATLVALPVVVLVGGWMLRNWDRVGSPVLTTEAGESLWAANGAATFAHFPVRSIDLSVAEAYRRLDPQEFSELVAQDAVTRDRLLASRAIEYMAERPGETLANGLRKVWIALSAQYTPARSWVVQAGYLAFLLPVHVLAAVGVWRSRTAWRTHGAVWTVGAAFLVTTAVFWAHTSHKSHLDPFLFMYAASVVPGVATARAPSAGPERRRDPGHAVDAPA